jgi:glycosyltransferase involved in cell wall biosynthesis
MKVLFLTNLPSPYRVDFFNELGKSCDLTVLYERRTADNRNKKWIGHTCENFKEIFLHGKNRGEEGAYCPEVRKYLRDRTYTHIIISGYGTPTSRFAILWLKVHKKPFIMTSDGGFIKEKTGVRYYLKRFFISGASAWLSTGTATTEYLAHYGAQKNRCFIYPFTSLKECDILSKPVSFSEKESIKGELGFSEKFIILSVGRFIYGKGIDVLLNAAKIFPKDVAVVIVGGTPTEEYQQIILKNGLKQIYFPGFKTKKELEDYYKIADLFVFPTREDVWGLVVNEAMAFGLPVITTEKCIAGLELVQNGKNGFIIPVEDSELITKHVHEIINNEAKRAAMEETSLKKIRNYTIENMASQHLMILQMVQKQKDKLNDESVTGE